MQKKLRDDAESSQNKEIRAKLKKERNKTLKEIKKILSTEQNLILEEKLKEIEKHKDDSNKYYHAIRAINTYRPKKSLKIYVDNYSLVSTEKEQVDIITKFFKDLFTSNERSIPISASKIVPPFTTEEVQLASKKLKNSKAIGPAEVHAEFLKYGTNKLYSTISNLLNHISETGDYPKDLRLGILKPIAKPPKKGEKVNVRPIILLSVLRKVLSIILINRCWDRMKIQIPPSQAAYQKGRSTTEQVFAIKIMAEKAITSNKYNLFLLLLDMSKAFDTVKRPKLMEILSKILTESELHMMHILINDVIINVKISNHTGSNIHTKIGICQGDCLSALLFILYLSNAIKPIPSQIEAIDYQKPMWSALDWIIDKDQHKICIDPKYADDISFLRSDESKINQIERIIPEMLKKEGLFINQNKTEKFTITRNGDESWKKCKYLGS